MPTPRRSFLKIAGATMAGTMAGAMTGAMTGAMAAPTVLNAQGSESPASWGQPRDIKRSGERLQILILGGTRFLGPHQVEYALARGHEVTLFNRGKTNPDLFPELEKLRGDRNDDLAALEGRRWDAVIDNSAGIPRWIRDVGELLQDRVHQYLFISSTGVFYPYLSTDIAEDGTLATLADPTVEEVTGETYGGLKALCEQESETWFPGRATVVRPHLIVGPGDNTDRFTYWPVRIARGGEVMAPGDPADRVQIIDVRDLARFCILCLEERHTGAYNALGPYSPLSIGGMLDGIRATVANEISFTWVDREFLAEYEVQPWQQMTVWVPPVDDLLGMCHIDGSKAFTAGLTLRPLADTARDTLQWWHGLAEERRSTPRAGCPVELEESTLAAWHEKHD